MITSRFGNGEGKRKRTIGGSIDVRSATPGLYSQLITALGDRRTSAGGVVGIHYYAARAAGEPVADRPPVRSRRALELATRASDRERLTILADWADRSGTPSLVALADTLSTRYPNEPDASLAMGRALMTAGRFLDARRSLERAVAADVARGAPQSRCVACDAMASLVSVHRRTDSLAAAERTVRAWMRLRPHSALPRAHLAAIVADRTRSAQTPR